MKSIPHLRTALQHVFTTVATTAARTSGFIRRQRHLTGSSFVQTLVFGFLAHPHASLEQLAQTAAIAGTPISAQGLAQRFTSQAAACLQQVLGAAAQQLVRADPVAIPLLQRFQGVYVLDSTVIMLPDALAEVWQGNGGRTSVGTSAALKVQVLLDLTHGTLQHLALEAGRANDHASSANAVVLPAGALRIADLGYFAVARIAALIAQQVFVLSRLNTQVALWTPQGDRIELLPLLEQSEPSLDQAVLMGPQRLPVRLLTVRVPQEVADQRRRRLRAALHRKGRTPSARLLALAGWTVLVTTVPQAQLTLAEAVVLLRARWQIELLFKLWKSQGQLDNWRSTQPWRILCEVYAKLLGMLVLHWVMLVSCWHLPDRSLVKAAQRVQQDALALLRALDVAGHLTKLLRLMQQGLERAGRQNTRKQHPNTYQSLLTPPTISLT